MFVLRYQNLKNIWRERNLIIKSMSCEKKKSVEEIKETVSKFFVKKLVPEAYLPKKGTIGAAGYDICAV